MSVLTKASREFMSRPADERFTDLNAMFDMANASRERSASRIVTNKSLRIVPTGNTAEDGLTVQSAKGEATLTHWSFGQLASLAGAPAGYLRTLPACISADCLNVGMAQRSVEEIGALVTRLDDGVQIRAATGPNYGRIWNADIIAALINRFGDGITGDFRVPGEFGKAINVTKDNTTLYCSDRNMFVFLADETNRITLPNRRNGQSGSLARGFFCWNSEVGSDTAGIGTFLFDYTCSNRMVWGAEGYREIKLRHTSGAPDRWIGEVAPTLLAFANSSTRPIEAALQAAQAKRVDDVNAMLADRFGTRSVDVIKARHMIEEGRPIETLWDVMTGATAWARDIPNTDTRLAVERVAGKLLDLVAA
jgi:hypothetical protein